MLMDQYCPDRKVVVRRSVAAEAEGFSILVPSCSNWARAVNRVGPLVHCHLHRLLREVAMIFAGVVVVVAVADAVVVGNLSPSH